MSKTEPVISMYPRIIEYLGYYPFPDPQVLGERLISIRRHQGLSRKRLAEMIGIDEGTVLRIERGKSLPHGACGAQTKKFIETISVLER